MLNFIKSLGQSQENCIVIVRELLPILGIKMSSKVVESTLYDHPAFKSLLSISDALSNWNIKNYALGLSFQKIKGLEAPFVAQVLEGGQSLFTIVKKIDEEKVQYFNPIKNSWQTISWNLFHPKYNGVVLVMEQSDNISTNINVQGNKDRQVTSVATFIWLITIIGSFTYLGYYRYIFLNFSNIFPFLFLTIKLIGSFVTCCLLWYDLDNNNYLLDKICKIGKSTNCKAVLQSSASRIFNFISWSEIGFVYFVGSYMALLLSDINLSVTFLCSIVNVFALPFILYSIYYQFHVVKQWCILCLLVQVLLSSEFVISLLGAQFNVPNNYSWLAAAGLIGSYLFVGSSWLIVKPLLLTAQEIKKVKRSFSKLKYNSEIFDTLLLKQKVVAFEPSDLGIILGNPNSKNKIIKVCNPFCGPCSTSHAVLESLLNSNLDLQVQIIFTAASDKEDAKTRVVKHLMTLYEKGDSTFIKKVLDDWYIHSNKDYDTFANRYPVGNELSEQDIKLDAMHNWCNKIGISFTPTIFINGYQLPDGYSVADMRYLLH